MILKNVKIINHDSVINNANVTIEGNKIISITPQPGSGEKIIVPGFIDTHMHGFKGKDSMDGEDAIKVISSELGKKGTSSFFPTVMTDKFETLLDAVKHAGNVHVDGAIISGIHIEGPFISTKKKGAHDEKYITKATIEKLEQLWDASNNKLKKITVAPEAITLDVAEWLLSKGVVVSIGHTDATLEEAKTFFDGGASSVTHLWNAMSGVANRRPGVVEAALNHKDVYAELICDLIHVDEHAIKLSINAKGIDKIIAVTDSIRPAGLPDGESESGGFKITKKGSKIVIKGTDTIAGSAATMYDNFKTLIMLGYDIKDVVSMTSYNAAKNTGLELMGEIKVGFLANINILDKKGKLEKVIINGKEN